MNSSTLYYLCKFRRICTTNSSLNSVESASSSGNEEGTPSGQQPIPQQLTLSDSCIVKLKEVCQDDNFLRVTVEGGGCSGFQYKFALDNKVNDDDKQFGESDARVVIDNASLIYCAGATVDYHNELIRSGFRIIGNPQAEQGCSCGSSFAIKLD